MNMPIDQVRETSNSIHNYLLFNFMAIMKGSRLGHKYVLKKNAANYSVTESKQGSELVKYDAKISDGNETLRIEMKTKLVAPGATLQEIKESALLRTSNLFFKDSKWLLVVAKYNRAMREVYDRGDFITFLSNCEFIIGCGQGYNHKWSTLKSYDKWGVVLRNAEDISSLFNAITNQGTPPPPPLLLKSINDTPSPPPLFLKSINGPDNTNQASTNNIDKPMLSMPDVNVPSVVNSPLASTGEIDKLINLYGFNVAQVADILSLSRVEVCQKLSTKKVNANYIRKTTIHILALLEGFHQHKITLVRLLQHPLINHLKFNGNINARKSLLRMALGTLCSQGYIIIIKEDGSKVKLTIKNKIIKKYLKTDELFELSLTTKAFIYAKSSNYKEAKEYVNSLK